MAKFLAIDANGLNMLFSGNDITFVKPHCKKKNSVKNLQSTSVFSKVDNTKSQVIDLSGFCTSQFQLELYAWETSTLKPIVVFNEYFTSHLNYRYLDNDSPPPRSA